MARTAKKETSLTAEEKLAQALVPEAEQPYKVPENWCWVTIGSVLTLQAGKNISSSLIADVKDIDHPYPCFGGNGIRGYVLSFNRDGQFPIIGRQGALCGNLNWAYGQFYATEHAVVVECPEFVDKKWAYYILNYMNLNQYATATAQPGLAVSNIVKLPLSLSPLAEQQRIVDRIESLFAKLDEAKEKAQTVVDGFEDRKAAILHKAFAGELTAMWRLANAIKDDSWEKTTVGECSELITKGASPKWQGVSYTSDSTQTLFVTSENVREGFLDWSKEKYLDNTINDIQKRSILRKGDVLVNIVGASIGRSAIFDRDCLANTNQAVCLVRVKDNLNNEYLCHYFNSPFALMYYDENKVETARANISLTNISDMPINLPTIEEQIEIVKKLNELIEREVAIKTAVEQVIEQIDTMKKAILARAFRGELGTNDPTDESAKELLKRIL